MAKQEEETRTAVQDINDSLTGIGEKVQKNSKLVTIVVVTVVAIVALVLLYFYAIRKPAVDSANNAIGQADLQLMLAQDSTALEQYQAVAGDYGYDAGNRANLNAAILLFKNGKYQEAINYLDDFKASESVIGAAAASLEGDCYVNLKNYDEAIKYFKKAADISDKNPLYTPVFLMKQANVYREQKNFPAEVEVYQEIVDEYPTYGDAMGIDMEKYLERAKLSAGNAK